MKAEADSILVVTLEGKHEIFAMLDILKNPELPEELKGYAKIFFTEIQERIKE